MERLRPEERDAVRMTYLAGFTYDEASRALRVPLGTLKSRLKTGLRKLREVFDLD